MHLRLAYKGYEFIYERGVVAYARENEDRHSLTTTNSIEKVPEAYLSIEDNKLRLAKRKYGGSIPPKIKKKLGRQYWILGRRLCWVNRFEYAEKAFQKALRLNNTRQVRIGSTLYKLVTELLSPVRAEKLSLKMKEIFKI